MKTLTEKVLRRVAYHEAGHAVVGELYDQRAMKVTIKPHKASGTAGRCFQSREVFFRQVQKLSKQPTEEDCQWALEADAVPVLAGEAADRKLRRMKRIRGKQDMIKLAEEWINAMQSVMRSYEKGETSPDLESFNFGYLGDLIKVIDAIDLLSKNPHEEGMNELTRLYRKAEEHVTAQWSSIQGVAAELLRRKTVSGAAVRRLMKASPAKKEK